MKKTVHDGVTYYSDLYTDDEGYTWNFLIREGGSLSLFATLPKLCAHMVAFDTLDDEPPNPTAQKVIAYLSEIGEAVRVLHNHI